MIRIGYYQFAPRFGAVAENLATVRAALAEVEADLLVLPELAFTGYAFRDRAELAALAEDPATSPTVAGLVALCRERGVHLVTGFAERQGSGPSERIYNSALLLGPGGHLATYRKLHLFNNETTYFDPGDLPLAVQELGGLKIGMLVCFDWAFPEVARALTLLGAECLCQPANLVLGYCQQAMQVRALENGVFAVTANRTGTDTRPHDEIAFTGRSQICGPRGEVLESSPAEGEALIVREIAPALARNKGITPRNDLLRDRRPAWYGVLTAAVAPPVPVPPPVLVPPSLAKGPAPAAPAPSPAAPTAPVVPIEPTPMSSPEPFKTADLCDVHGEALQVAVPLFTDYGGLPCFAGPITTVKVFEDNALVRAALEEPGAGRILIVDGGGSLRCALVGGNLARLAAENGWAGLIVNGAIRDRLECAAARVGIRALNTIPRKSVKKGTGHRDIPLRFANVEFKPGEWLYADEDGICVSPERLTGTGAGD